MGFEVKSTRKRDVVDITDQVQQAVDQAGVKSGSCTVFTTHTTAGLTVAEGNPDTNEDLLTFFEKVAPDVDWVHAEADHAMGHVWAALIGPSLSLIVEEGKLVLGTWQRVVLVELDGPKSRRIKVARSS